jgi:hypothetical protein
MDQHFVPTGVPDISYDIKPLAAVELLRSDPKIPRQVTGAVIDGRRISVGQRFITSFCAIYGVSPSIFNLFDPSEVIERVVLRNAGDSMIRVAIEEDDAGGLGHGLAVSRPSKVSLSRADVASILAGQGIKIDDVAYDEGIITSWHAPRIGGDVKFDVSGDDWQNRFMLDIPIDGYGSPNAYLSLLREVCQNGMIAYAKTFRTSAKLGREAKDALPTMSRFVESFNNEGGFVALRQRLESAVKSPASLDEFYSFYKILMDADEMQSLHVNEKGDYVKPFASKLTADLKAMCGSLEVYGLVNHDTLTAKKRRTIPVSGTIYDLVNFATEVSTHRATPRQARRLQAWVGTIMSNEFDLEGILDDAEEPQDLFLDKAPV